MQLPDEARAAIEAGRLAHLVTLNADGSPQVSCVWVGLDGDEVVSAHLSEGQQKLRNVRRDPRVALSIEADEPAGATMQPYLVVHGRARVSEGGAPELIARLRRQYLGPDAAPSTSALAPGFVLRITVERIGGIGPWEPLR
jgi:PPOX class probable F420-dependent enzyme